MNDVINAFTQRCLKEERGLVVLFLDDSYPRNFRSVRIFCNATIYSAAKIYLKHQTYDTPP